MFFKKFFKSRKGSGEDFDKYLREIFGYWLVKGDVDFNLLQAFDSILRIAGYANPKQTIQSWITSTKELVAEDPEISISELGWMDIDLSVKLEQLDVEACFFRLFSIVASRKIKNGQ